MLLRAAFCGLAALCLLSAPTSTASKHVANYPQVHRVNCTKGSGSAFLTEQGWVSVAHVTNLDGCVIEGHPISAIPEGDLDFSTLKVAIEGRGLKINCEGFKALHWYFAIGYAGGYDWQTMTRHVATFKRADNGLHILLGTPTVIPGMSGGVLLNEAGEAVGTVNAYNLFFGASYSRALKDTSLCQSVHPA